MIPNFMIQGEGFSARAPGASATRSPKNVSPRPRDCFCMDNHGPTNGGQSFITQGPKAHLDGSSLTIFGECRPTSLVNEIASVRRDRSDRPAVPVIIRRITITR
nr:peptidylprolyl isomerase [Deltaproteobacteria bacterium]